MNFPIWFDDLPVLGKLPAEVAAAKLEEVGEHDAATALQGSGGAAMQAFASAKWWPFQDKPWQHTAHAFGYLAPSVPTDASLPIRHAGNIAADTSLKSSRIK